MKHNHDQVKSGDLNAVEKDFAEVNRRLKDAGSKSRIIGKDTEGNAV